ncbi:MAG: hypothetical protein JNG83_06500 [Opitutaceae bacterium]|nr:hypothetical protein [Opitutaceae bacterium]
MNLAKKTLLLVGLLGAGVLAAAEAGAPLAYARFDLANGLKLRNVVVKNYDAKNDRFLLVADGKAITVPAEQVPQPFRSALRRKAPAVGATTAIVSPVAKGKPAEQKR